MRMKTLGIKEKLQDIDFSLESISLGDFDAIGEYTAKKNRSQDSDLYRSVGCFFRPNYERGILIYALITKFKITSFLEVGFGRGYSTFCAAKAMTDLGLNGKIMTIDPNFNEEFLNNLTNVFPSEWFEKIKFMRGKSEDALEKINEKFDMVYIDGDHTYDAVSPGVQCATLIDEIEDETKELIIMDRRIFVDDRGYTDSQIDYGQVLLRNKDFNVEDYILTW
jgi:hypothetical protein